MKDLGTYAAWKATKTTGQFDLKTFEVKAAPAREGGKDCVGNECDIGEIKGVMSYWGG